MGNITSIEQLQNDPLVKDLIAKAVERSVETSNKFKEEITIEETRDVSARNIALNKISGIFVSDSKSKIDISQTNIIETLVETNYLMNKFEENSDEPEVTIIMSDMSNMTNEKPETKIPDFSDPLTLLKAAEMDAKTAVYDFENNGVAYTKDVLKDSEEAKMPVIDHTSLKDTKELSMPINEIKNQCEQKMKLLEKNKTIVDKTTKDVKDKEGEYKTNFSDIQSMITAVTNKLSPYTCASQNSVIIDLTEKLKELVETDDSLNECSRNCDLSVAKMRMDIKKEIQPKIDALNAEFNKDCGSTYSECESKHRDLYDEAKPKYDKKVAEDRAYQASCCEKQKQLGTIGPDKQMKNCDLYDSLHELNKQNMRSAYFGKYDGKIETCLGPSGCGPKKIARDYQIQYLEKNASTKVEDLYGECKRKCTYRDAATKLFTKMMEIMKPTVEKYNSSLTAALNSLSSDDAMKNGMEKIKDNKESLFLWNYSFRKILLDFINDYNHDISIVFVPYVYKNIIYSKKTTALQAKAIGVIENLYDTDYSGENDGKKKLPYVLSYIKDLLTNEVEGVNLIADIVLKIIVNVVFGATAQTLLYESINALYTQMDNSKVDEELKDPYCNIASQTYMMAKDRDVIAAMKAVIREYTGEEVTVQDVTQMLAKLRGQQQPEAPKGEMVEVNRYIKFIDLYNAIARVYLRDANTKISNMKESIKNLSTKMVTSANVLSRNIVDVHASAAKGGKIIFSQVNIAKIQAITRVNDLQKKLENISTKHENVIIPKQDVVIQEKSKNEEKKEEKIEEPVKTVVNVDEQKKTVEESNTYLYIAIAVVILMGLGIVIIVLMNRNSDPGYYGNNNMGMQQNYGYY